MVLRTKKIDTSTEDFEARKENAIRLVAGREFVGSPRDRYKFTERELREEFDIEDADLYDCRTNQVFFNGDFVIYCKEKILLV